MKYGKIPFIPQPVSRILFGTATKPLNEGGDSRELLDAVFDMGINFFDCARVYGLAERSLGDWMQYRGNREEIVLLSKCGHPDEQWNSRINEREMRRDLAVSLKELQTDYIDLYLLHRDDPEVPVGEVVEIFNALRSEGKIRAFGVSNWSHHRIQAANDYAVSHQMMPFVVSSPNFSLADQKADPWGGDCVTISGASQREARDWYIRTQMPMIAYSSLAHGLLSGKLASNECDQATDCLDSYAVKGYAHEDNFERLARCEKLAEQKGCTVSQIAMAWIFYQHMNAYAIVSSSRISGMRQNVACLDVELSDEELLYLDLKL